MKTFKITYHFVSTKADGRDYTRSIEVHAKECTDTAARIEGWNRFGHLFTQNCTDWTIEAA